ncbi:Arginyl-tRNA synthetase [Candidatus Arthromitus sp. SFB-mouse-SU]|nr:arginyl-tRNA synthetase [Candidatus Arthromitus sp. SFB-mouse-NYU]EIA24178.1 Arginyl-tRNA synthetase [Candidatus Arthromitus sp. SFB-3]EIA25830.1 Arginyl-tRNA synthetase [Candidatus Arthromitus sp. SFB-4]EIA28899.1 Arginyl-tRNA synthetase [Candidatus Arthromitus sp. SFB-co]EIA29801.1 Arginyl-tRNA synthetase [Candidatus Arthromitus sp. SFB-5]EIA29999.1 Arginyl-tRNA synthetase [Candidatus Arthromitus sp. SFB-mouse-SU]BAK80274.1 arginyl-tRNA synthetase [Candidatus Arthromitus sp. SFB-mouse-Yi
MFQNIKEGENKLDYRKIISDLIEEIIGINVYDSIEIPPDKNMGDLAFPCFKLAKELRKSPQIIAEDLKLKISHEVIDRIETVGAYLNFFVDKSSFSRDVLSSILKLKDRYGESNDGEGKTIVIDYSSPNIAKPFHIGHLFTTVIGNSLYRLHKFQGYDVVGINYLGDWGTQFGKLIYAYKRWVDIEELKKNPISELFRIYVKFHNEAENDPSIEDEGRKYFKMLEDGDEECIELWKKFRELSLLEFEKLYKDLGVKFDSYDGEAFFSNKTDAIVCELEDKNLLDDSFGARVVRLDDYNMPPCIIKKADGATIYATRDLASLLYRKKTYNFYKNIYVAGIPQALHFKQVFKTVELMGYEWAKDCIHVGFGLVKFKDKKLSSRKGEVILLEDLLNMSIDKIRNVIEEKNPNLSNKDGVSKKVGIGAIVFTYLKMNRERDIIFDFDDILSFEGETGPYVQYTFARGKSILKKSGIDIENIDTEKYLGLLTHDNENNLIKVLSDFNNNIKSSISYLEPSIITRYVIDIAKAFNKFYNSNNILNLEDENLKISRLILVYATTIVIKNALYLIGIETVDEM